MATKFDVSTIQKASITKGEIVNQSPNVQDRRHWKSKLLFVWRYLADKSLFLAWYWYPWLRACDLCNRGFAASNRREKELGKDYYLRAIEIYPYSAHEN